MTPRRGKQAIRFDGEGWWRGARAVSTAAFTRDEPAPSHGPVLAHTVENFVERFGVVTDIVGVHGAVTGWRLASPTESAPARPLLTDPCADLRWMFVGLYAGRPIGALLEDQEKGRVTERALSRARKRVARELGDGVVPYTLSAVGERAYAIAARAEAALGELASRVPESPAAALSRSTLSHAAAELVDLLGTARVLHDAPARRRGRSTPHGNFDHFVDHLAKLPRRGARAAATLGPRIVHAACRYVGMGDRCARTTRVQVERAARKMTPIARKR